MELFLKTTRSMHVYDALHHAMHQTEWVYVHCACGWGMRNRCQKLCAACLVGTQRTVQNYGWSRTLWRPSHAFLPVLHRQEILSRRPHVMRTSETPAWPQTDIPSVTSNCHSEHGLKLTFLISVQPQIDIPKRDRHVCMHVCTYAHPENRTISH